MQLLIVMLAYEVPLLMIMLTVAMKVGGGSGAEFSLTRIMDYQAEHGSFGLTPVMWPAFLAWLMFLPATLGVPPDGRAATVAEGSGVPGIDAGWRQDREVIRAVVDALEAVIRRLRGRIDETDKTDLVTQDLLISIAQELEKSHWMWQAQLD